jgi:hypothetical protein
LRPSKWLIGLILDFAYEYPVPCTILIGVTTIKKRASELNLDQSSDTMSPSITASSKADKVAKESMKNPEETVPAYIDYTSDERYQATNSLRNYRLDLQQSSTEATGSHSLTLDKDLIFPSAIASTALYSLNHPLNTKRDSIILRRSVPDTIHPQKLTEEDLWEIFRPPNTRTKFQLFGETESTHFRTGEVTMKSGLSGQVWECEFEPDVLLRGKDGLWTDGQGVVVAREVNEVIARKGSRKGKENDVDGVRRNPGLKFLERRNGGEDRFLVDLMVAVWCAKMWCAETWESRRDGPSMKEGEFECPDGLLSI